MKTRHVKGSTSLIDAIMRSIISVLLYWVAFTKIGLIGLVITITVLIVGVELMMQRSGRSGKLVIAHQGVDRRWAIHHGDRKSINDLRLSVEMDEALLGVELMERIRRM